MPAAALAVTCLSSGDDHGFFRYFFSFAEIEGGHRITRSTTGAVTVCSHIYFRLKVVSPAVVRPTGTAFPPSKPVRN